MPVTVEPDSIHIGSALRAELTIDGASWRVYQDIGGDWTLHSTHTAKDDAWAAIVTLALGA
jgi:hypothetical protein